MPAEPANLTLLLAEDDENDAFFFRRTLRLSGAPFQLHHVTDGAAAVKFLQASAAANTLPKVVFLDLKMPLMNGFDVLSWMNAQNFSSPIEVIVLSGSDRQQDRERVRQLGVENYLVKPVKPEVFATLLEKISTSGTSSTAETHHHA